MNGNNTSETPITENQDLGELLVKVISELEKATPNELEKATVDINYLKELLAAATPDSTVPKSRETPLLRRLREEDERICKIRAAAILYIGAGKLPASIARIVKVSIDTLTEWINSPEWKEALEFWGFFGEEARPLRNRKQSTEPHFKAPIINLTSPRVLKEYDEDERTPYPLTEKFLIEQAFQKEGDVRFVTYAQKFTDASIKKVDRYKIHLDGDRKPLEKVNILLVFAKSKMSTIRNGIKRRDSLADKQLPPIRERKGRDYFTIDAPRNSFVECVMRNGLVVKGELIWIGRWNLILRVGENKRGLNEKAREGKIVLVYRHGLYEFSILQRKKKNNRPQPRNDYWDSEEE